MAAGSHRRPTMLQTWGFFDLIGCPKRSVSTMPQSWKIMQP